MGWGAGRLGRMGCWGTGGAGWGERGGGRPRNLEHMPQTTSGDRPHLSIGQAAQRTGLSVHALRFYEREGLLPTEVSRGPDGRRVYSENDLEWLDLCVKLRSSGMPLTAIRGYADLVKQGAGNEKQRLDILREHQQRVTAQLAALKACRDVIAFKVKFYEERLAEGATGDPIWDPPA
jgi:DNA-binding transcriptional MerR regulator